MTAIGFDVPHESQVSLVVYDVRGRLVTRQVESEFRKPGRYSVTWDGRDANGAPVAAGMYLYHMRAGSFSQVRKMLVVK